jgi:hypothetical protein
MGPGRRTRRPRHRPIPQRTDHEDPPRRRRPLRPLAFVLTAGQAGDAPVFTGVMSRLCAPRQQGRLRTRPDMILADKAYSSRAIRDHLRKRGIRTVIPVPADQRGHRLRRGSQGAGHLPSTARRTSSATPSNAASTGSGNGAASPPATRRQPRSARPGSTLQASSSGPPGEVMLRSTGDAAHPGGSLD